ncbi:hypothetical protein STANM309S_04774 [Streptomyces tanashiensis]
MPSVAPPKWRITPQTALSAVCTAPSAQPAVQEMSSPARKMPRLSSGSRSCMKCVNRPALVAVEWPGRFALKAPMKKGSFSQETSRSPGCR